MLDRGGFPGGREEYSRGAAGASGYNWTASLILAEEWLSQWLIGRKDGAFAGQCMWGCAWERSVNPSAQLALVGTRISHCQRCRAVASGDSASAAGVGSSCPFRALGVPSRGSRKDPDPWRGGSGPLP